MGTTAAKTSAAIAPVTAELQWEIEQFLFTEAEILDQRRWRDWYNLLTDDVRYQAPLRSNREQRELAHEYTQAHESHVFDDNKYEMNMRIKRLETGMAWAENPPSRTRHMITNVRVRPTDKPDEFEVRSYFHFYRTRLERQEDNLVGERFDILRRADNEYGWMIARRLIHLDQATILLNNLSMFL